MPVTRIGKDKFEMKTTDSASITSRQDPKSIRIDRSSVISTENLIRYETNNVEVAGRKPMVANMEEIALKALHVDDDATLNPWTFRMLFLGK